MPSRSSLPSWRHWRWRSARQGCAEPRARSRSLNTGLIVPAAQISGHRTRAARGDPRGDVAPTRKLQSMPDASGVTLYSASWDPESQANIQIWQAFRDQESYCVLHWRQSTFRRVSSTQNNGAVIATTPTRAKRKSCLPWLAIESHDSPPAREISTTPSIA